MIFHSSFVYYLFVCGLFAGVLQDKLYACRYCCRNNVYACYGYKINVWEPEKIHDDSLDFFAFDTEILLADVTKPEISNIPTLTRPVTSSVTSRSNFTPCLASSITWLSNGVWILEIGRVVWEITWGPYAPPPPKKKQQIERVTHQTPTGRGLTFEQYYIFPENFKSVTPLTSEFIPKVMLTRAWPGEGGGELTPPPNIRDS